MEQSKELTQFQDINVELLIKNYSFKLSLYEIGRLFNLDIENDNRNKVFWNINVNNKVLIDDLMFEYLGYKGMKYNKKKYAVQKLLTNHTNNYIKYEQVADEKYPRKKYYVLSGIDFESLLMQMRTDKVVELRRLFSKMKTVFVKYCEYEKMYERHQSQMLYSQNNFLVKSVEDLKSLVVIVKSNADEERARAEEEQIKAEERERKAEEERRRAEERERQSEEERDRAEKERFRAEERERRAELERARAESERYKAEEERYLAEQRAVRMVTQMKRNYAILNTVIAPLVAPRPIGNKIKFFGMYFHFKI